MSWLESSLTCLIRRACRTCAVFRDSGILGAENPHVGLTTRPPLRHTRNQKALPSPNPQSPEPLKPSIPKAQSSKPLKKLNPPKPEPLDPKPSKPLSVLGEWGERWGKGAGGRREGGRGGGGGRGGRGGGRVGKVSSKDLGFKVGMFPPSTNNP